jgi:hypothetical protein
MPTDNAYLQEMKDLYNRTLQTGNKISGIVCPHSYDTRDKKGDCRLCELCKTILINRDTPKNDPLKEKARNVNSKKKFYSNIILLANPSEVVVLEYGEKIFNKLIAGQMDELSEWKNFMHPAQGRNLYVTKVKIGPEKKDVDYNVEPRMSTSPLTDPSVLTRLYDINNIMALIESGKVKPVYQSKFDFQKTEVRFLPSGDKTKPLMFFKLVLWHYNVSKEEFDAIQRGIYNPITGIYTQLKESFTPEPLNPSYPKDMMQKQSVPKTLSNADLMAEWGGGLPEETADLDVGGDPMEENFETEIGVEPICFGQFDKDNATCTGKCLEADGWGLACKKIAEERLALRARAKRLSK